jgi:hypothetical protein
MGAKNISIFWKILVASAFERHLNGAPTLMLLPYFLPARNKPTR